MRLSTTNVARASARHPWRTLGFWLGLLVLAGILQGTMGGAFNGDDNFTNNPDSKIADELINARMAGNDVLDETIVVRAQGTTVDDPAYRQVVEQTTADVLAMTGVVASATNYYEAVDAGDAEAADSLVSDDQRSTIIPVTMVSDDDELFDHGAEFVATAQAHRGNGFEVYTVGDLSGDEAYGTIAEEDLAKAETVGLPVALIILVVVFGALLAARLPLMLASVSIFVRRGPDGDPVAGHDRSPFVVTNMITMIGLAVGIDYALFVVERYREERRHGAAKHRRDRDRRRHRQQGGALLRHDRRPRAARHVPDPDDDLPQPRRRRDPGRDRRGRSPR